MGPKRRWLFLEFGCDGTVNDVDFVRHAANVINEVDRWTTMINPRVSITMIPKRTCLSIVSDAP